MTVHVWTVVLVWLDIAGVATAMGALLSPLCLFTAAEQHGRAETGRAEQRLFGLSLALLCITTLGLLWARTVVMSGMPWQGALSSVPLVLGQTHFGHVWQWRLGILAAAWLTWWRWGRAQMSSRGLLLLALCLIAVLAFTRSASGHPADQGDFTLREFNDWLHLTAAAVWMGTVMVSALFLSPRLRGRRSPAGGAVIRSIQRLSNLAGVALMVVLTTGVCNALWAIPALTDLWTTGYGRLLLVKLALIAVLILFGAVNRYYFLPRLRESGDAPRLHRQFAVSLILESLVMIAAMNVVAQLTQGVPPKI